MYIKSNKYKFSMVTKNNSNTYSENKYTFQNYVTKNQLYITNALVQ